MNTEIFGTFGPACRKENILEQMIKAGMTGIRLNLSHTTLPESAEYIEAYQKASEACGVFPQILIDMKGPELRVGRLRECIKLPEVSVYNQEDNKKLPNLSVNNSENGEKLPSLSIYTDKIDEKLSSLSLYNDKVDRKLSFVSLYEMCGRKEPNVVFCTQEKYDKLSSLSIYNNDNNQKLPSLSLYIPVPDEALAVLEIGDEVLLDDGKILLKVIEKEADAQENVRGENIEEENCEQKFSGSVKARILRGGTLASGKSIKIRDKYVNLPPLTMHDIENIKVAEQYGVTALMQPFVLSGEDIREVRRTLKEYGAEDILIFAKIENRMGVAHLQDILPEADVIVIARGDLGNDMPLWELPRVQKEIEKACRRAGKPYIVVTQMLASMEENPVPTRAEVSDIYHAVFHGAWGVMLTGETAVGKYPVEAVTYLANTAREAER